ncbi:MAG TPA: 2-C-methyl-D-erythritol 2,4-cyclodiphosphate synthase [Burkholderiaceae bacterium]|jgi:2-C-methyl-D-erythritol 2,4-cyclodiphosphate synthase|nr:2-C-methyl-D-erythritol 2,4-cyclodiphosphate synthase [Burkholderiaceae bacterium]
MVESIRVGQGFDVHALVPGRRLVLGGVSIEHERGLLGHSDADVLLHAIADALLGAAGLGDIGRMFPDSDPRYRDADSGALLAEVAQRVQQDGWRVANVDCTVIAEQPRIAPHVEAIRGSIAQLLQVDRAQINVKGKTAERLGAIGRGEAIAASVVVLLTRL